MLLTRSGLRAFRRDSRGNVAVITALVLPVLMGSLGLGAEVAVWYSDKRALQNAADSAAIAAATNADPAVYDDEARAVAASYGFTHGVAGVTVETSNAAACPGGGSDCYRVTISKTQPLMLARFVGFNGDATVDGSPAKRLAASAVATRALAPREYCIVALAGSGAATGIQSNGAPHADLSGCSLMSNSNANCNGHNLNADFGDAAGANSGCGRRSNSGMQPLADSYAHLASNIPEPDCPIGYDFGLGTKKSPLRPENHLTGPQNWSVKHICGNAKLDGDVTIQSGGASLLVINGGRLDLSGYTLETAAGSSLTIIFTGDVDPTAQHIPTGGGKLDIQAPTSGPWSGVAIYQDPALTQGVHISDAGNSPAWAITGLVYLPRASVSFSGAVGKASHGLGCFVLVVDTLEINGTGRILSKGQCANAGLQMPASMVPTRGQLVS